jgi:hypothetical protein
MAIHILGLKPETKRLENKMKQNSVRKLVGALVFVVALMLGYPACQQATPTQPDPPAPVIPACQTNNTADITFQNKSGHSYTYDVIWDGSLLTTLGPGATSKVYTEAAGSHTLHFMISNSRSQACTESSPVLAQCQSYTYWCTE